MSRTLSLRGVRRSCHCESREAGRSNLGRDRFVAALLAMTLWVTFTLLPLSPLFAARSAMDREAPDVTHNFSQAHVLITKGDYTGAMEKLTAILIEDPGNGIAREQIYQVSQLMGASAQLLGQTGGKPISLDERADAVDMAYRSLRKTSPRVIERRLQEAMIQEKRKSFLLACQIYLAVLQLPGLELEKKYQVEKRLRAASQKVDSRIEELANEESRRLYREAFTLMNVGDWEGSVEDWQKYSEKQPKDAEVQRLLSMPEAKLVLREKEKVKEAYEALDANQVEKARFNFEQALRTNPNSAEAVKGLDLVEKRLEDEKKVERVDRLVSDAEVLVRKDQKYRALQLLSGALRENPSDPRVLSLIQNIMDAANSPKKVIVNRPAVQKVIVEKPAESVERLASRDSGKAETHYQKGLVYYSLRNYREAFNEWKVAVQYDPNSRKITQALQRVQSDLQFEKQK